jgi:death-on-curing protein
MFGGLAGIPNPSLVASAVERPYNGHYNSIERKCAALVESMSRNHGFADGNKRTSIILLHTLLTRSGYKLFAYGDIENLEEAVEQAVVDVVIGKLAFDDLVAWLRVRIRRQ